MPAYQTRGRGIISVPNRREKSMGQSNEIFGADGLKEV